MSHEVVAPVCGSVLDFHRMYLGDAVVVGIVAVTVVLEVDTRVCCGGDNARSSNDGFRTSRRIDECEAEEAPIEKESTTLPNVKQKKKREICVPAIIRRRRKGELCTRRIAIIIIVV
jgi:hypothetical protein